MIWLIAFIVAVISYFIGSVNSSIILSRLMGGKDIREEGSGNAGATNMLRTHGKKAGAFTLLFDMLKGVIAVLLALLATYLTTKWISPQDYQNSMLTPTVFGKTVSIFSIQYILPSFRYISAFFVVIGHDFPVFFGFKGGKGIATSAAVMLMLDWKIALVIILLAFVIMLITRYVSLASVITAIAYPLVLIGFMLGTGEFNAAYLLFAILLGLLAVWRHKANIHRLLNGTESKLGQKKKGDDVK